VRVVLTGFRGTGKTAVGQRLAVLIRVPFSDTDHLVEVAAGRSIPEIFAAEGETGFRLRERAVIHDLPPGDRVISTGGGAVLDPDNVAVLRRDAIVIHLTADPRTIEGRIRGSGRPALTPLPLREEIQELLVRRRPVYLSSSDHTVDTTGKDVNETCLLLLRYIKGEDAPVEGIERFISFHRRTRILDREREAFASQARIARSAPLPRPVCCYGESMRPQSQPRVIHASLPRVRDRWSVHPYRVA